MQLYVIPNSLNQRGNHVTGNLGKEDGTALLYKDKPIVFTFDLATKADIFIPESLEPIYPLIEDAVMRYFVGK
ncbi:MAG: hypothetical protein MJ068_05390 [Clostridia bacterium]|nr:hypothetical protein [Clostridia bacterium]